MTHALLLSLLVALSAAPGTKTAPRSRLQAAQLEFNQGDFQGALKLLDLAVGETSDDATLAKIHLLRGQAYGAMRDLPQAEQALASALEHDPEATLDPNRVDPSLVTMLQGLKARLQGTLDVSADRAGAKVSLDGKPLGQAPLRAQVGIGRHRVDVRTADGRWAARQEVVVYPRRVAKVSATLAEAKPEPAESSGGDGGGGPVLFGFGKPVGDLRLQYDPIQWTEVPGIEIGGGLQNQWVRVGINLRVFPQFGFTARGAFVVPLMDRFKAYIELELPVIFYPYTEWLALGLGGAGGADYEINRWLVLFGQVGARHFFLSPLEDNRLTLQGGVRLRMP